MAAGASFGVVALGGAAGAVVVVALGGAAGAVVVVVALGGAAGAVVVVVALGGAAGAVIVVALGVTEPEVVAAGFDAMVGAVAGLADVVWSCWAAGGPGRRWGPWLLAWIAPAPPVAIAAVVRIFARTPVAPSPPTPAEAA